MLVSLAKGAAMLLAIAELPATNAQSYTIGTKGKSGPA
jgi:hypothetical protein